ncbi:uncharacterized protein LOC119909487 [Scomber scombrus]|uniref:Uncharacterized protein LOC119909487 n=1 Tax=Scomber scombrus TaxID=13677 RepID=A0AAV1QG77_SCOSC
MVNASCHFNRLQINCNMTLNLMLFSLRLLPEVRTLLLTAEVADHPCEVFQQLIEQIHHVLQEQSRLLALLKTVSVEDLLFPACVHLQRSNKPVSRNNMQLFSTNKL